MRLLTKATAVECAPLKLGVRVNSIHPGVIWTKMGEQFLDHVVVQKLAPNRASAEAAFKERTPIGWFGEVGDIAEAPLFLASDASKYVTGTELVVDGGLSRDLIPGSALASSTRSSEGRAWRGRAAFGP